MLDTVVISGDDVCCSVVFGTLVGVFSVMWSELLLVVLCGHQCTNAREWSVCSPYHYLLPTMYLSVAHITNPDLFACGPGFVSTSPAFMRSSASHPAGLHG